MADWEEISLSSPVAELGREREQGRDSTNDLDLSDDALGVLHTEHGILQILEEDEGSPNAHALSLDNIISESIPSELFDTQSELVGAYFAIVCPIFSTFDSEQNLFRTFVSQRWQSSISMFYAIMSMAAAKLTWTSPDMKLQALQYQSLALSNLYSDVCGASGWTTELLFVVLMLGLSTSWHDITDLGIAHLKAMQAAVLDGAVQRSCDQQILGFFRNAVVYWEMVVCSVNDEVSVHDYSKVDDTHPQPQPDGQTLNQSQSQSQTQTQTQISRIMPHPWAGVASAPQELFARVARHIRQVRSFSSGNALSPDTFLESLNSLEGEIWRLELPKLHEIANTGDLNTPAIHHLLLAEAYMFATLYQLYYAFPSRREKCLKWMEELTTGVRIGHSSSWAEQQARSWPASLLRGPSSKRWVDFLGRNIIMRLEQIQINSGTSCVHSLLLLVGSGSLAVTAEVEDSTGTSTCSDETAEILRTRQFVLDRLSQISDSILSEPISQVKLVVVEMFKRLDVGVDVFWMDILHSMGVVTIIG